MGKLRGLEKLDLRNNIWASKEYEDDNIENVLDFLDSKTEEVEQREHDDKSRTVVSKELRTAQVYKKKLYKLSGIGTDIAIILEDPKLCNLSVRNSFLLSVYGKIYAWIGKRSNTYCKDKAVHLAKVIEKESSGCAKIIDYKIAPTEDDDFWEDFGETGEIPDTKVDSEESFSTVVASYRLYIAQEKNERVTFEIVQGDSMSKLYLTSANCVVLDDTRDIWLWRGSNSSENQQSYSMLKAEVNFHTHTHKSCYPKLTLTHTTGTFWERN